MEKFIMFLAKGITLDKIKAWISERVQFEAHINAIKTKYGAEGVYLTPDETNVVALCFPKGRPNRNWKPLNIQGLANAYVPKTSSNEQGFFGAKINQAGDEIAKEIYSRESKDLTLYLSGHDSAKFDKDGKRIACGLVQIDRDIFVAVPRLEDYVTPFFEPQDCERVTLAQYYDKLETWQTQIAVTKGQALIDSIIKEIKEEENA